jgi:putative lipoprotein
MNFTRSAAIIAALISAPLMLSAQSAPPASSASGATAIITGTALYRERIALPPNAVFEAVLEDTSRADAPATRIASTKNAHPGNPPFHFTIAYDPSKIVDSHTYNVRAFVTFEGKLMFTSTSAHRVITSGNPTSVNITLRHVSPADDQAAVTAGGVAPKPLENSYWKLATLNGKTVAVKPDHREPSLILHPEGMRTEVFGGCNQIAGTYTLESSNGITFGPMAGTLMACPDGMDTEKDFTAMLNEVRTYRIAGARLELLDEYHKIVASFDWRPLK